ncbi:unnamed protein product [Arabis nemorensis]|uniref:Uncharacterized protein n=1 Tax=Arabis nemorensis TaxID=586526 RepID=A0A565BC98_9BRAS|nr:unnamed protein product [Arabis nemorensis]
MSEKLGKLKRKVSTLRQKLRTIRKTVKDLQTKVDTLETPQIWDDHRYDDGFECNEISGEKSRENWKETKGTVTQKEGGGEEHHQDIETEAEEKEEEEQEEGEEEEGETEKT